VLDLCCLLKIVGYAPSGDLHMLVDILGWIYFLMRMLSLIFLRRFDVDDYLMDGFLIYLVSLLWMHHLAYYGIWIR
jgi:hypothetical protein